MLTVTAPAKLNLTLEVLGKRPDGYHAIKSVLQTIDLSDTLHFESATGITFQCDMPGWSAEASLVSKAVDLLKEVTANRQGAAIVIEKSRSDSRFGVLKSRVVRRRNPGYCWRDCINQDRLERPGVRSLVSVQV